MKKNLSSAERNERRFKIKRKFVILSRILIFLVIASLITVKIISTPQGVASIAVTGQAVLSPKGIQRILETVEITTEQFTTMNLETLDFEQTLLNISEDDYNYYYEIKYKFIVPVFDDTDADSILGYKYEFITFPYVESKEFILNEIALREMIEARMKFLRKSNIDDLRRRQPDSKRRIVALNDISGKKWNYVANKFG